MRGSSKKPIINDAIEADPVRLVGADGEQVGIVSIADAREAAAEAKLDLVLIAPDADPQVCKIRKVVENDLPDLKKVSSSATRRSSDGPPSKKSNFDQGRKKGIIR